MSYRILYQLIITIVLAAVVASCTYKKIDEDPVLPQNVSFQNDLIPLFNTSCNSAGCHATNGIPPDLTEANSYDDLMNSSGMVDVVHPEKSELYLRMVDVQSPMPPSGVMTYPASQVLSWITDGAKNN
ncbi:MAG: hypothetical protein DRI74_09980 [Bacteroidetes bacterium]|nr:MAG: hypothetical protein DRI74_09980 [Bacteroidota bacterium]